MGSITKAQQRLLEEMAQAENEQRYEDAEVVCAGIECWIGTRRISVRTLQALLKWCAIREEDEGKSICRYTINNTGRAALIDPTVIQRVRHALVTNQPIDERGVALEGRKWA